MAEVFEDNAAKGLYRLPGREGLYTFYATGQWLQTGAFDEKLDGTTEGWHTPYWYYRTKTGEKILGASQIGGWWLLPALGVNPLNPGDDYFKTYGTIAITDSDRRAAQAYIESIVSKPGHKYTETMPTGVETDVPLPEPQFYNARIWKGFEDGDSKKIREWAEKIVAEDNWIRIAAKEQQSKKEEVGGIIAYPWDTTYPRNEHPLHDAIWRYPLLNEVSVAYWALATVNFEAGNKKEAKKWMRKIIEEVPYHQIADGYWTTDPETGQRYFLIKGYWNALISWEFNPGNIPRDAQMGVLYREVLREMGLRSAAPKEISIKGLKFAPPSTLGTQGKPQTQEAPSQPIPSPESQKGKGGGDVQTDKEVMSYLEQINIADPGAAKRSRPFQKIVSMGQRAEAALVKVIQGHELTGDPLKWAAYLLGVVGSYDVAKPVLESVIESSSYPWYVQVEARNGLDVLEERFQKQEPKKKPSKGDVGIEQTVLSYLKQLTIPDPTAAKNSRAFREIVALGKKAESTLVKVIQNRELEGDPLKWSVFLLGVVGSYEVAKPVLERVIQDSSYPWYVREEAKNGLQILLRRKAAGQAGLKEDDLKTIEFAEEIPSTPASSPEADKTVMAGGERYESTLNLPDATVRIEGAPVDPAGLKFEGDVYIYNNTGQPVKLSEAGRFFPKTPEGKPLVKDTVIVIKPSADAVAAASPIGSSPTGRKLTSVVLALTTTGMICLSGCGPDILVAHSLKPTSIQTARAGTTGTDKTYLDGNAPVDSLRKGMTVVWIYHSERVTGKIINISRTPYGDFEVLIHPDDGTGLKDDLKFWALPRKKLHDPRRLPDADSFQKLLISNIIEAYYDKPEEAGFSSGSFDLLSFESTLQNIDKAGSQKIEEVKRYLRKRLNISDNMDILIWRDESGNAIGPKKYRAGGMGGSFRPVKGRSIHLEVTLSGSANPTKIGLDIAYPHGQTVWSAFVNLPPPQVPLILQDLSSILTSFPDHKIVGAGQIWDSNKIVVALSPKEISREHPYSFFHLFIGEPGNLVEIENVVRSPHHDLYITDDDRYLFVRSTHGEERTQIYEGVAGNFTPGSGNPISLFAIRDAGVRLLPQGQPASSPVRSEKAPEEIYQIVSQKFFPLLTTLPNPLVEFPENFVADFQGQEKNNLILVYTNNGYLKIQSEISAEKGQEAREKIVHDYSKSPALKKIIYKGKEYSLQEIQDQEKQLFKDTFDIMSALAYSNEGGFLYRAIKEYEWEDIKKNGYWMVQKGDNFEDHMGPMVQIYSKEESYAGIILKIPIKGPYFAHAGMAVPRVVSVIPHFVHENEIKVSRSGEADSFMTLSEFKSRTSEGSSPMVGVGNAPGGIDLNPALLDLQIRRDGNGVPLPLPQQPIENMHIDGFLPIIINITPVTNLPLLLGLADTKQDADEIAPAMKAREPEEVSYLN